MTGNATSYLKRYFGYDSFRPGQAEIIEHIVSGHDCLVIMPTGGGKSVCYQIPALMKQGCAIVVSPLIALMSNQVESLKGNGIAAATVNSMNSEEENKHIIEEAFKGNLKLLYISPERLITDMPAWNKDFNISLIAIDEAHCISQWGHDFRPVYTRLSIVREQRPEIPIMALTATADRLTRDDIAHHLNLRDPYRHFASFDRPNISLSVLPDPGKKKRLEMIRRLHQKYPDDSGIVYCLSRKKTEDIYQNLLATGLDAVCYHAGMSNDERAESQRRFISGDAKIVCATVAFGMGIDKSNIRWVVHNNVPGNIESYYQEIGRAGRDGLPAEAVMFYNYGDIITREAFIASSDMSDVFQEKLDRIKEYAEASVCRRRILLSYFNEERTCDCGNCDVCQNPPVRFNGTIAAQKAMSAIIRTGGNTAIGSVIDILRGSLREEIRIRQYDRLKTFGAGREYDAPRWKHFISQMIQLGLISIAYEENNHLKVTPYGMKVLRGIDQVYLTDINGRSFQRPSAKNEKQIPADPVEQLFAQLKKIRRKVAKESGMADYVLFNDATLYDMALRRPVDLTSFGEISGVSDIKASRFWKPFVGAIRKFEGLKATYEGATYQETLILYNANRRPTEIAKIRGLKLSTVYTHSAHLIENSLINDFERIVTPTQYNRFIEMKEREPEKWHELLDDEMPDGMWRIIPAIEKRGGL